MMQRTADLKTITTAILQCGAILVLATVLSLTVNHLRRDGLPLVRDLSSGAPSGTAGTMAESMVSIEEARTLFETGGAVFIDARSPRDYKENHIPGALNIPAENFDEVFPSIAPELNPDSLIITYCDGETCPLAQDLAFALAAKGLPNVRVLTNGWSAWQNARLPVEAG